ncbi:hypothetical protein [Azoarcus sp. DN11]|uniref:hypothetical protein n=1 Tax=Azoarcus sp. DN11 TaxID=356837 RepID=UPI000EAFECFB|nr:hypothetical protein [Azoarcus sp. DN11]AYH45600.1 hypothetical protein CDA09_19820 [Azoarcus sp. DN11]
MYKLLPASLALALGVPACALAAPPSPGTASDLAALRQEIDALRAAYEARLQAMEQRLQAAEAAAHAAAAPPVPAPVANVPPPAGAGGGANAFNPAISLILSGLYTRTSKDPKNFAIAGFPLPGDAEAGPGTRGFSLAETELGLSASIDPWWRGAANISLHPDNKVSVEEAYVQTTSLGHGMSLKAGRFFSGVGYLNSQHSHTWDFVDNPLAYQAMLGTQFGDDGVQLTWLAPIDQYLELGAEAGRGRSFPGTDTSRNGAGMVALTAHTGGDIGASHSWRAGVSLLHAKADGQALDATDAAGNAVTNAFTGRTRVWIADAVWKWAPNGNATRTNFKLQGEYLHSTRDGDLVFDVGNADRSGGFRVAQSGWYLQGIWQFMPGWRVGLRTERLDSGAPGFDGSTLAFADRAFHPHKNSLMFDYSPSEFSRVRLQFARDRSRDGVADNQFFVQYQMSLGAHGAHSY